MESKCIISVTSSRTKKAEKELRRPDAATKKPAALQESIPERLRNWRPQVFLKAKVGQRADKWEGGLKVSRRSC